MAGRVENGRRVGDIIKVAVKPEALRFRTYRTAELEPAPATNPGTSGSVAAQGEDWGMHLNDQIGCCVIADEANAIEARNAAAGRLVRIPDAQVKTTYMRVSGWNGIVGDPSDTGCDPAAAMDDWRHNGLAGDRIGASVIVHCTDRQEVMDALYYLEGAHVCLDIPDAWLRTPAGGTWDVSADVQPNPANGHSVYATGKYDLTGMEVVSWNMTFWLTWEALAAAGSRIDATVDECMLEPDGESPLGLDIDKLNADLGMLPDA